MQAYDHTTHLFREELEAVHSGSNDALDRAKKARLQSGVELVTSELTRMNRDYEGLMMHLRDKLVLLGQMLSAAGISTPDVPVLEALPVITPFTQFLERSQPAWRHTGSSTDPTTAGGSTVLSSSVFTSSSPSSSIHEQALTPVEHRRYETLSKTQQQTVTVQPPTPAAWQVITLPDDGRNLSLADAISLGLLDVEKETFRIAPDSQEVMTLSDAVRFGYLNKEALERLHAPCGVRQPITGREFSLSEVLTNGAFDAKRGLVRGPDKSMIPLYDAFQSGYISLDAYNTLAPLSDAIQRGDAVSCRAHYGVPNLESTGISVSICDSLELGLYNEQTGKFIDPVSGQNMSYAEAIDRGLIDRGLREVVDPSRQERLTVPKAISRGLIDPHRGLFQDKTFVNAKEVGLLTQPLTLQEIVTQGCLDPISGLLHLPDGSQLSFAEAFHTGLIDVTSPSVFDNQTGRALSLNEAVKIGLVDVQSGQIIVDAAAGQVMSLPRAVNERRVDLMHRTVLVRDRGVLHPTTGECLSLVEAARHGLLDPTTTQYIDVTTGARLSLAEAAEQGLVTPELVSKLEGLSGLRDKTGREMTVMEAIRKGHFDPELGRVSDAHTNTAYTLEEAANSGILAPEKSRMLMLLTSPVMAETRRSRFLPEAEGHEEPAPKRPTALAPPRRIGSTGQQAPSSPLLSPQVSCCDDCLRAHSYLYAPVQANVHKNDLNFVKSR